MFQHFNRNTYRILINSAILGFAFEGMANVLYNLYILRLGYDPEFVGIANAAGLIAFAVASLLVGFFGFGTRVRLMIILGQLVISAGFFMMPLAESVSQALQPTVIMGSNIVFHIGVAMNFVCVPPFIMNNSVGREHTNILSVESAIFSLSTFAGSLFGGYFPEWIAPVLNVGSGDPTPFRLAFIVAGILVIPVFFVMLGTDNRVLRAEVIELDPEEGAEPSMPVSPGPRIARVFLSFAIMVTIVRIIQSMGLNVSFTFFNVYFDEGLNISSGTIGFFTGFARLLGAVLVLSIPWMVRRWGMERTIIVVSLLGAGGMFLLGISQVWWVAGIGQLIALGLNSMRFTLFTSYIMEETPMRWHSLMAGLNETTGGIGFAIMSLVGGYMITNYGYTALFSTGAGLLVLGTLIFLLYVLQDRRRLRQLAVKPSL
ncbi:MAG: MFS transporter [Chloroflexota bacterium]